MKHAFAFPLILITALSLAACSTCSKSSQERAELRAWLREIDEKSAASEEAAVSEAPSATAPGVVGRKLTDSNIRETLIYDENSVKITAMRIDYEQIDYSGWGVLCPMLKILLRIENDRPTDIRSIIFGNTSVNGILIEASPIYSIPSGTVREEYLYFNPYSPFFPDLFDSGITDIRQIELQFCMFDDLDHRFLSDRITLTTDAENYVQTYRDSGSALYARNGVRIVPFGLEYDENYYLWLLNFYIENNSGEDLMIRCSEYNINGIPCLGENHVNYDYIPSGKRSTAAWCMMTARWS